MVLVQKLLHAATRPYFSMLELWLCQGVLNDPYAEFMVEEEKVCSATSTLPVLKLTGIQGLQVPCQRVHLALLDNVSAKLTSFSLVKGIL